MWEAGPSDAQVREALKRIPEQLRDADALDDADVAELLRGRQATLAWRVGDLDKAPVSLSVKKATPSAAHEEYATAGLASLARGRAGKYARGALDALAWVIGARGQL